MQQKGIASILILGLLTVLGFIVFSIFFIYPRFQSYQTIKYFYEPRAKSGLFERQITDRKITSVKPSGESIVYKSINFLSPWGLPLNKIENGDDVTLQFERNINLIISYNNSDNLVTLSTVDSDPDEFIKTYKQSKSVSYELQKLILETQPNQIGLFTSPNQAKKITKILVVKMIDDIYLTKGGIYSFTTSSNKGFQSGDPGKDNFVILHIYDSFNNFIGITISGASVTQSDLDTIISSIQIKN